MLDRREATIRGLDNTTIDRIGTALATGLDQGLGSEDIAAMIDDVLGDPSRAMTIARTESADALIQANLETYRDAGVEALEWVVADPCEICQDNAGVTVMMGEAFPSGDSEPPAHPNCVCDVVPVLLDSTDQAFN
jgi:SPP1 gp7 family putative phage head morphogenesis protein